MQRERNGSHVKGKRGRLANRKAKVAAAEKKRVFMVRYRVAMGKDATT